MIAGSQLANIQVADSEGLIPAVSAITEDPLRTRLLEIAQPAPYCQFYDVTTKDGTVLRYVDLADPDGSATAGKIDYDGNEYETIRIERTAVQHSSDGALPTVEVAVADPLGTVWAFCKTHNGLVDATVQIRVVPYDKLADSSYLVESLKFRVKSCAIGEGPAIVTFRLGAPDIFGVNVPYRRMLKTRCLSPYHLRHDKSLAVCSYPDDEFEWPSSQVIYDVNTVERTGLFGWTGENITKAESVKSPVFWNSSADGGLEIAMASAAADIRWDDAQQNGPWVYKTILDSAASEGTIDVQTKINRTGTYSDRDGTMIGLLVRSVSDPSDWIFWGWQAADQLLMRSTSNDVSTDNTDASLPDNAFRIEQTGSDSWKFYSRVEDDTEFTRDPVAWTQRHTLTLDLGGDKEVGVVVASDDTVDTGTINGVFHHVRFLSGGLKQCDFSLDGANGCDAHKNTPQYNGFPQMPDALHR